MSRKLALKKLKASDLSFFQTYLARHPQTKQKGFNLDRDVIETAFYPSLTEVVDAAPEQRAAVGLSLYGPGAASLHFLMRKVLKQQKNWRLNGETIYSPDDALGRYDVLAPEDIAIMEFSGASMPSAVKIVLLAAADPRDAATHAAFASAFPSQSMTILTEEVIEAVIADAGTPADHPIRDWLDKELLEEAALGDTGATEKLLARRRGRGLTPEELKRAKASAEEAGRLGEELLDYHLTRGTPSELAAHTWVSMVNAISPFDFLLNLLDGTDRHVDAKATRGDFSRPIHLSVSEMQHAATSGVPYDLCRLYHVTDTGATFRTSRNIAEKVRPVLAALGGLPAGVKVEALSFNPDYFEFGDRETRIEYSDDEPG